MLLDLKFSIGTLGLGAGTLIAGLYGMNLKNFVEESDMAFIGVSAWTFVFAGIICVYGLSKLRKTQRLSMWGESGSTGKRGWLSIPKGAQKPMAPPAGIQQQHIAGMYVAGSSVGGPRPEASRGVAPSAVSRPLPPIPTTKKS